MLDAVCKQCGVSFKAQKSELERGQRLYCGRACYAAWKRAQPHATPKPVEKKPPTQEAGKKCRECGAFVMEHYKKFYCSDACSKMGVIKSRSVVSTCAMCGFPFMASKYDVAKGMGRYCSLRCNGHAKSMAVNNPAPNSRAKGGRRKDLENRYFRSSWEANYARYMNWLISTGGSQIVSWEFEPKVFIFPVKRGNTSYTPDFKVHKKDGTYEWHEVKGWMDANSKVKLKRMAKFFPGENVVIVGRKEYTAIARQVKDFVPGWEFDVKKSI